jgi:predicted DNA-binding transcriptional regulator AlpA
MRHATPPRPPSDREFVSRETLCRELDISRATSYRYERDGYLPAPIRIGPGIVRWPRREIDALLARLAADRGTQGAP